MTEITNTGDPTNITDSKLGAIAVLQPRLFTEPREQSRRWRTTALEAIQTEPVRDRFAKARHQRKDRRVHRPNGDRRINVRRQVSV